MFAGDLEHFLFEFQSLGTDFPEPASTDYGSPDTPLPAIDQGGDDKSGRDQYSCQIHRVRHIEYRSVNGFVQQGAALEIDKMDSAFIAAPVQVGCQQVAQFGWIIGSANYNYAFRVKKGEE
jgi:hypothetical protein